MANYNKNNAKKAEIRSKVPAHMLNLSDVLNTNASLRTHVGHGITNYLLQKGIITNGATHVKFGYNKFKVTVDGLGTEYSYKEPFFINCFVAGFKSFTNRTNYILHNFCIKELESPAENIVDNDSVEEIVNLTHKNYNSIMQKSDRKGVNNEDGVTPVEGDESDNN